MKLLLIGTAKTPTLNTQVGKGVRVRFMRGERGVRVRFMRGERGVRVVRVRGERGVRVRFMRGGKSVRVVCVDALCRGLRACTRDFHRAGRACAWCVCRGLRACTRDFHRAERACAWCIFLPPIYYETAIFLSFFCYLQRGRRTIASPNRRRRRRRRPGRPHQMADTGEERPLGASFPLGAGKTRCAQAAPLTPAGGFSRLIFSSPSPLEIDWQVQSLPSDQRLILF